ncbi:hypothetical protein N3K66_002858 [Trichothecium roseum]|uniref:Uncharacterized protein n=1 Tax=Trichothecium roseum TaxID=47278 RepID=A0ACC0V546_9HYPO|nr:hypothetical protein N3K66_002858 [Trichothecium roseum]
MNDGQTNKHGTTGVSPVGDASNDGMLVSDPESLPELATSETPYSIWSTWHKRAIVLCASLTAFFSPLTAQIYLPALPAMADDLGVSDSKMTLTITTYMIFQGIVPMFVGSLADSGGRRPAYLVCFVVYIAANIALALAPNFEALLGIRCVQSTGSAPTVALCQAVVADIATSAERGSYIGYTIIPAVLAPSLGPVLGGVLSQELGWRSIFWFLAIFAGTTCILIALFFPETCRPIVGDGSISPPLWDRTLPQLLTLRGGRVAKGQGDTAVESSQPGREPFKFKPPNVLGSLMMLLELETGILLLTSSLVFAGFYALAAAMPSQLTKEYGLTEIQVGLMYLPHAAGSVVAAGIVGPAINRNYKRHCDSLGISCDRTRQQDLSNFPIEQARLQVAIPLVTLGGASLLAWGWSLQASAHIAVPCVMLFVLGIGMIGFSNATNALLIDLHPGRAGTAAAANNLSRCLVGAGASAVVVPAIDGIGIGWTFTIAGALYVVCIPALLLCMARGPKWREQLRVKNERKAEKKRKAKGII